ncbi:MAG: hypothetical protein Q8J99_10140 [Sulfuritalea sp.]|nr:hypothetical protein [Sulfuritalea sp.]
MDEARWWRLLERLPEVEEAAGPALAVAFIDSTDYAAKRGQAWLWWPGSRARATGPVAFDGHYPADWGLLLVMSDTAIARVGADGTACMAHLSRQLDIKPFVLQQRDGLEAAGILEFIESLELATPKH